MWTRPLNFSWILNILNWTVTMDDYYFRFRARKKKQIINTGDEEMQQLKRNFHNTIHFLLNGFLVSFIPNVRWLGQVYWLRNPYWLISSSKLLKSNRHIRLSSRQRVNQFNHQNACQHHIRKTRKPFPIQHSTGGD